jgi:hypothetical protein
MPEALATDHAISFFVAAGIATVIGLVVDWHLPRPSTVAAGPEFIIADQVARQKDRDFYARRVTALRLREAAYERDCDETVVLVLTFECGVDR